MTSAEDKMEKGDEVLRDYIDKEHCGIVWGGIDYEPVVGELMRRGLSDEYAAALAQLCKFGLRVGDRLRIGSEAKERDV